MNKGLKIALIIAGIGAVGVGGYFIYQAIKRNRDGQDDDQTPVVDPPANVQGGNENSNEKTPFTNKAQGNLFREWVNKFYPSYASSIDLSVSGDFDNSFMRKAWGKYGEVYKKGSPNFLKVKGNEIPSKLLSAYNVRKDKGVLGSNASGAVYLRTITLGKIDNKDVYAYFYSSGNVSFLKGGKKLTSGKWWDDTKQINVQNKNYKGDNFYNSAFKVFTAFKQGAEAIAGIVNGGQGYTPTFPFDGNLKSDLDAPSRRGLDLDMNIID
jgi:hypothetical protein